MILTALATFGVTLALTPLIRGLCIRAQILDRPGPLKPHTKPIPRLGGAAVFAGIVVGAIFASAHAGAAAKPFFAALALIWIVGLIDDLRGLQPAVRLAAQIGAAAMLWRAGWRFLPDEGTLVTLAATCMFVVLCVNALNFLDGADGLAAGCACLIALAYAVVPKIALSSAGSTIAIATAAACAAFLIPNAPPASLFLGDEGSTVLGFTIAFLGLDLMKSRLGSSAMVFPFAVAALPLLDALLVATRRIAKSHSPWHADRLHFYDLLFARNWTPRAVALFSWGFAAASAGMGVALFRKAPSAALCLAFAPAVAAIWIATSCRASAERWNGEAKPAQAPKRIL